MRYNYCAFILGSSNSSRPAPKNVNNNDTSRSAASSMKNLTLQEALKKQFANNENNRIRGPPPPTPNRNVSNKLAHSYYFPWVT